MRKSFFYIIIIAILLIGLVSSFFIPKANNFWSDFSKVFSLRSLVDENISLRQKNQDLENQYLGVAQNIIFPADENYFEAKVFSSYPFNIKNRIYINLGKDEGVVVGDAVTFSKTVLVGIVSNLKNHQSEVMTVFDPKFSLPVRIGNGEVDGLLQGGLTPKITLIDKTKKVSPDDGIVSASKDIAYGLSLGKVKLVREDSSGAFLEAVVDLPYSLSDIRSVFVIRGTN